MIDRAKLKAGRKVAATIEARMTSSRLPGKVLMEVCGKPVLELMVERVRRIEFVDEILIATTDNAADNPLAELAGRLGVGVFRGSENDVLNRVARAAEQADANVIVELTGDCPMIDSETSSQVVETYLANEIDYVSTGHHPKGEDYFYQTYPAGVDTQVFSADILATANREATEPAHREHLPQYILASGKFSWSVLPAPAHLRRPELNLSLDTREDFDLIKRVFDGLYPGNPEFGLADVLSFLDGVSGNG